MTNNGQMMDNVCMFFLVKTRSSMRHCIVTSVKVLFPEKELLKVSYLWSNIFENVL